MDNNQMMQVFENNDFGTVRGMLRDGEPWFVAADVCKALEILNTAHATSRLDDDEKAGIVLNDTSSNGTTQRRSFTIVNEPGLYSLILSSRKPEAKQFKRWITHDVIPTIRKAGGYIANEEVMVETYFPNVTDDQKDVLIQTFGAMRRLQEERKIMAPKAEYCDMVLRAPNAVPVTKIAKDYGMSGKAFNKMLNELGVQFRMDKTWMLYSQYQDKGYTKTETHVNHKNGYVATETKWTQDGRLFLYKKLKRAGILPVMERKDKK